MKLSYPVCYPENGVDIMAWNSSTDQAFAKLHSMGYQGVELLVRNPDEIDKSRLHNALNNYQLSVSAIGTTPMQKLDGLFLLDKDEAKQQEAIRRLYGLIDLAADFKAPVLIGKYRGNIDKADGCRMEDLIRIVKQADVRAGEADTCLYLEPQNETNINNLHSIEETASWIRENSLKNVKLLMDIYHMHYTENSSEESLKNYTDLIGMIHMADSERQIPGEGTFQIEQIMNVLSEIKYTGFISMEIKQAPNSETAAKKAAEALLTLKGRRG